VYPKLLESPNVQPEDKRKIRELLKKPWNPYVVGRHASLTQKSRILKESSLRVFAGWTPGSDMPKRYIRLFGNAACEDVLEAYGLVDPGIQINQLKPKQCPNCNEPGKPDSKFCPKCRMVLTYDAYGEAIDYKQQKDDALATLSDQVMKLMTEVQELKKQGS
jgi:hypothetical protein